MSVCGTYGFSQLFYKTKQIIIESLALNTK